MFSFLASAYARVLGATVRAIARTGVHPNVLTIISIFPALLAGALAANGQFWGAALLLLLSGVFDLLDGGLARATGRTSRFGALLDSSLDRLSDAAVPAGLLLYYAPFGAVLLVPTAAMLAGYTVSYVRARAEGLAIDLPRLWMRREDRMAILVAALLLAPVSPADWPVPAGLTLLGVAVLAVGGWAAAAAALLAAAKRR